MKLSRSLQRALIEGGMSKAQIHENVRKGVYEIGKRYEDEMSESLANAIMKAATAADGLSMIERRAEEAAKIISLLDRILVVLNGAEKQNGEEHSA